MEEKKVGLHKICLIDRQNINISGVLKVNSTNPTCASLKVKEGDLVVNGANLNIDDFSDNNITITGNIDSLKYTKTNKTKTSFFKRIFR